MINQARTPSFTDPWFSSNVHIPTVGNIGIEQRSVAICSIYNKNPHEEQKNEAIRYNIYPNEDNTE